MRALTDRRTSTMKNSQTLSFDEVASMLQAPTTTRRWSEDERAECDNCRLVTHEILDFGGADEWEMPVVDDSPLEVELAILRARHGRHHVRLCYACTDALEEPVGRAFRQAVVVPFRTPDPVVEQPARLFELY